jgi:hypothetical protein
LRTLSALRTSVQDTTIRDGLAPYTLPDIRAKYLDAKSDIALDATWITFEMENLVGLSELTTLSMLFYLLSMGRLGRFFCEGMLQHVGSEMKNLQPPAIYNAADFELLTPLIDALQPATLM